LTGVVESAKKLVEVERVGAHIERVLHRIGEEASPPSISRLGSIADLRARKSHLNLQ
jgi:hypothetical protein